MLYIVFFYFVLLLLKLVIVIAIVIDIAIEKINYLTNCIQSRIFYIHY
jgi:hypothetical protein